MIRVWARKLRVPTPSLTIPVSSSITTEQVIGEALARFRREAEPTDKYQLVKVTLESGRGELSKQTLCHTCHSFDTGCIGIDVMTLQ